MVELVDTLVLGTSVARRESSSLSSGTKNALVTQWFRVPRLHRGGRWFESNREHTWSGVRLEGVGSQNL